jgi:hypothetical protein
MPFMPSPKRKWVPVILVIGILAAYLLTYQLLVLCSPHLCNSSASLRDEVSSLVVAGHSAELAAYAPRVLWVTAVGAALVMPVLCIVSGIGCLLALNPGRIRRRVGLTIIVSLSGLPFFLIRGGNPGHPWRQFLHAPLLADTPAAWFIPPILDVSAFITTIFMSCVAAAVISEATNASGPESLETLLRARTWIGLLLYLSAGQLVVSLLRLHFFFSWSLAYIPPLEHDAPAPLASLLSSLNQIASTIVTAQAVFYTGLLVALYLPVIRTIRSVGDHIIASGAVQIPRVLLEEWPRGTTWDSKLPKLLALLSPLLSGLIGELAKAI